MAIKKTKLIAYPVVVISAIILTTIAIDAADNFGRFSNSLIGRLFLVSDNESACPAGMVLVESPVGVFCIDEFENSAGKGCPMKLPARITDTDINLFEADCKPEPVKGALPWTFISQDQAKEACAKAGKRLPTSKEWLQAALGTPDKGSDWAGEDCNVSGNWERNPGPAGYALNCRSGSGAYDMIGNVWEWTDGVAEAGVLDGRELPEAGFVAGVDANGLAATTSPSADNQPYHHDYFWIKKQGRYGIAQGGYWDNKEKAGQYSAYLVSLPTFSGSAIGFRCVRSARPSGR